MGGRRAKRGLKPGAGTELFLIWSVSRHTIKSAQYRFEDLLLDASNVDQAYGASAGQATPHGLLLAERMGEYYRGIAARLAHDLECLWPSNRCSRPAEACALANETLRIVSDSDERDVQSAARLLATLAPGCGLAPVVDHVLLHEGRPDMLRGGCSYASEAEVSALYGGSVQGWLADNFGARLDRLSEIFGCCKPSLCAGVAAAAADEVESSPCGLRQLPSPWEGGYWATWGGGLEHAEHLANTLMLQFANNGTVAGGVAAAELPQLYAVAEAGWSTYKNALNAQRLGGSLAAALAVELGAASGLLRASAATSTSSTPRARFQYHMAHDVNVAFMHEYLGVRPQAAGWPMGASAVFRQSALSVELHRNSTATSSGALTVRVSQHAPSPAQMRALDLRALAPSPLPLPLCSAPLDCPVDEFLRGLVARITRRDCIEPRLAQRLAELESRWQAPAAGRELPGHAHVGVAVAGWLIAALTCLTLCGALRGSRSFPARQLPLWAQFRTFRDKDLSCSL